MPVACHIANLVSVSVLFIDVQPRTPMTCPGPNAAKLSCNLKDVDLGFAVVVLAVVSGAFDAVVLTPLLLTTRG